MIPFDRNKYLEIVKAQGARAALTQLHQDTERWEHETFEGKAGWDPKSWEMLKEIRNFSRELWQLALTKSN